MAGEVRVSAGECSRLSLTGEEGREKENKLVKLLDLRKGTKVLGLLEGERRPVGTSLLPIWSEWMPDELGLMPKERRRDLSIFSETFDCELCVLRCGVLDYSD